ncbi:unnamed protein product [Rotaria magnacalcarata]|uniref:Translation initiation factor eIF2B subunit gamma n=1 Tax=Rotaria magnacalcarata TaxID=392030 RepID=A0A815CJ99_9BILA|nr:unnamed protein product [Rotaria magnacalcarata]CAF1623610.1 unnamed protein product [Rotaria magnacalcarata]CAF2130808.1 unnamed protein product [Rotaria magnacalcarata]CAF3826055.1 unnamed protein product [Rotaria magnacalcarata]
MKEFTVILYAGGNNRLSTDLSLPKPLLPVGNRPLIWYNLQIIQSHPALASSVLLILTSSQSRQVLDDYLSTLNITYELIVYRQHHESTSDDQQQAQDELGTLDILRSCYSRIRTESICLFTCDLYGKVNLTPLINMFRVRDASICMLLLKTTTSSTTGKESLVQPGQKVKYTAEPEFYTVDQSTNSVTSIRLKADLDEYFPLKQNILAKYPRTIIRTDLVDAHLYLIKKSCLDIAICSKYSSFRKEFLPKMIRQMATGQSLEVLISTTANKKMMIRQTTTDLDDHTDLSRLLEQYNCDNKQIRGGCYYSINETQVFRVKNVLSYLEANRQASSQILSFTNEDITFKDRLEQIQISPDCVVGDGHEIGKRTTIKRTIIGKNCRIEDKCKIINCVLLENVYVKEGVTLQNSILCSRSTIGSKSEILNSIICSNQQVEGNRKLNGETVSPASHESDVYMVYDDEQ